MKRIDVLKGIEQILVQKTYEMGHISHRADGDWQKTNDGWVRVKSSPTQSTSQSQESIPTEDTEYGEITEEDLSDDLDTTDADSIDIANFEDEIQESNGDIESVVERIIDLSDTTDMSSDDIDYMRDVLTQKVKDYIDSNDRAYELHDGGDSDNALSADFSGYADNFNIKNGVVRNGDLEKTAKQILADNNLEINNENMKKARNAMYDWLDENGYLEVAPVHTKDIDFSQYDDDIRSIGFRDYGNGELEPDDDELNEVIDKVFEQTVRDDMSYEEEDELLNEIEDRIRDRAYELRNVQKSAVRDMRSTPVTKNMGF